MRNFKYSWQHIAKASFVGIATTATFYLAKTTGLFSSWFLNENSTDLVHSTHEMMNEQKLETHPTSRKLLQSSSGNVMVVNPVPDQVIEATTAYQYDLSHVLTGNYSLMSVTLANSSPLPTWLSVQYLPVGNYNTPDYCYKIQVVNDVAYLADNNAGLFALNVSNPSNITLLSNYNTPGLAQGLHIVNNIAYVADGSSLLILNVSNPLNITQLGRYISAGSIRDVYVQAGLAYAISLSFASPPQLVILNVSNPSNITYLSNYTVVCTDRTKVQVRAGEAYLTCDNYGFIVLNISNPSSITLLNTYDTQGYVYGIKLLNDVAYVADYTSGLLILNISNPVNITRLGSYDTPGQAYSVQVQSGVAYVADGNLGMQVLNVSDFSHITYLGTYAIEDNVPDIRDIQVQNGLAYLADYNIGLKIIDLSQGRLFGTPTTGRVGESYTIQVSGWVASGVAAYDNFQLTVDRIPQRVDTSLIDRSVLPSQTLSLILDSDVLFTNPSGSTLTLRIQTSALTPNSQLTSDMLKLNPIFLGNHATLGGGGDDALGVKVLSGVAYVGENNAGLHVMDVSNPTAITTLSRYNPSSVGKGFRGVDLRDNLAYVADSAFGSGLQIFNISNSSNLIQLGKYDTPGEGYDVEVHGDIAYLADRYSGLQILNVSNPANITSLGSYFGYAYGVQVQNGLAYVAAYISGLQILNVTNPRNITLLGSYDTPSEAHGVFVQAGMAYVADLLSGLQVLNVSNSSNITYMGSYDTPGAALSVQVLNGVAYVADGSSGLQILNVSNPMAIIRLGSYGMPGFAADVQVQNNLVYIADGLSGTYVLDLTQWEWSVMPTPAEVGNYRVTIIATDELGGSASASFQLRVEGPPRFNSTIPTQYAKVGQAFNYFIPQGLVSDPNNDPISFTAVLMNNQSLPSWLSFSGISAAFVGTPQSSNVGNVTILLSATDNIAGSVSTIFQLVTSHLPVVNQPLSNVFVRVNQFFQLSISNNTFSHPDGLPLSYSAQLSSQAALPSWLRFNTSSLLLSGQPNSTDAGVYDLRIIATDIYLGQAAAPLTLSVGNGVQINRLINSQLAAVSQRYTFAVPSDSFVNLDGTAFSLQPSALPSWLTFAATTAQFSGTPLASSRGTTLITLTATDINGGTAMQVFNMTVTYFPQVVTPLSDQIAPIDRPYQFNVSNATFIDQNGYALTYRAEQANGQALPNWLNFNATALRFFGTPNITQALRYSLTVIATNPLGAEGRDEFSLFAEHYPTIQQPIPNAVAGVDIPSSITISGSSFNDLDNDPLNYTVTSINQSPLPNWLSFDARTLVLSGTPLAAQLGNISLLVTATDPSSGSAQQNFTLTVRYLPKLSQPVDPIPPVREEQLLNYTLPAGTFTIASGAPLNYNALLDSGASLPAWLNFTAATQHFIGTPTVSDIGSLIVRVIAEDGQGGAASTTLTFVITPNYPPVLVKPVSNEVASVYQAFRLVIPPDTFSDANNDPLTYSASQVDGRSLPRWLHFDAKAITFSGTPDRGDTGDFSEKIIPIRLTARDDRNGATAQFNINVQGTSSLALFIQIAAPLATVFTAVYAAYKKRALCFNRYKKERYQSPDIKIQAGEMFEHKFGDLSLLGKKIQVKTPRELQGYSRFFLSPRNRVPGGGDMPSWMKYNVETNSLQSKIPVPDNSPPELIVQVKDEAGVVYQQFTLHIAGLKTQLVDRSLPSSDVELSSVSATV